MTTDVDKQRDQIFLKLFLKKGISEVTDEEIAYFRDNPEQIDEITAPVAVHKLFLWVGALLGALFVGVSKVIKFSQLVIFSLGVREFVIDIVFEIGVALIGAAVTAYILGILLNQQQENAKKWRSENRCSKRINHQNSPQVGGVWWRLNRRYANSAQRQVVSVP